MNGQVRGQVGLPKKGIMCAGSGKWNEWQCLFSDGWANEWENSGSDYSKEGQRGLEKVDNAITKRIKVKIKDIYDY